MQERRRYFRIDDRLGVELKPLEPAMAEILTQQIRRGLVDGDFRTPFDARLQTLLEAVNVQQPLVAEALALLNRKLDLMLEQMALDSTALQELATTVLQASISACGLAVASDRQFPVDSLVQVDLSLLPGEQRLTALARVVVCDALPQDEGGGWYLRLDYREIHPDDQELLIQHVLRRQGVQLRRRQDTDEAGNRDT